MPFDFDSLKLPGFFVAKLRGNYLHIESASLGENLKPS